MINMIGKKRKIAHARNSQEYNEHLAEALISQNCSTLKKNQKIPQKVTHLRNQIIRIFIWEHEPLQASRWASWKKSGKSGRFEARLDKGLQNGTLKFNLKYVNFDQLWPFAITWPFFDLGTSEIEEPFAGFWVWDGWKKTVDEKTRPNSKLQKLTLVKFDLWMAKVPQFQSVKHLDAFGRIWICPIWLPRVLAYYWSDLETDWFLLNFPKFIQNFSNWSISTSIIESLRKAHFVPRFSSLCPVFSAFPAFSVTDPITGPKNAFNSLKYIRSSTSAATIRFPTEKLMRSVN